MILKNSNLKWREELTRDAINSLRYGLGIAQPP